MLIRKTVVIREKCSTIAKYIRLCTYSIHHVYIHTHILKIYLSTYYMYMKLYIYTYTYIFMVCTYI